MSAAFRSLAGSSGVSCRKAPAEKVDGDCCGGASRTRASRERYFTHDERCWED